MADAISERTPDWLDLLHDQLRQGLSQNDLAREIGVSKALISLVLSGKYRADTRRIRERVLERWQSYHWPFLGHTITLAECRRHAHLENGTQNPLRLMHAKACRSCDRRPAARTWIAIDRTGAFVPLVPGSPRGRPANIIAARVAAKRKPRPERASEGAEPCEN